MPAPRDTLDLLAELRRHGVDAADSGRSIRAGNIGMPCPFCGAADSGRHMSISIEPPYGVWSCWRVHGHSGGPRSIARLLLALRLPPAAVGRISEHFAALAGAPRPERRERAQFVTPVSLEPSLRLIGDRELDWYVNNNGTVMQLYKAAYVYLGRRWRYASNWRRLAIDHDALVSMQLPGRVVLPVHEDGAVVNYVARAMGPARTKYLTHPAAAGTGRQLKDTLYGLGRAQLGGRALAVVEGAFDAISVAHLHPGVNAVATFGTAYTGVQVDLIRALAPLYNRVLVLYDGDAAAQGMRLAWDVSGEYVPVHGDPEGMLFDELAADQLPGDPGRHDMAHG